ncbi:hypothetical protein [Candidatus Palauibacter sp.]|uniref:hypothetical protein n=1 Tax=Candidatus Palauibacter sp. TaxID=3101350 RepID=UPI003B01E683
MKLRGTKTLLFTGALALAGCAPDTGTDDPGWPGETWSVSTAEAEGIDPAAIDSLIADIDAGRYGLIDHSLLVRNGRVIADQLDGAAGPDPPRHRINERRHP